VMEIATTANFSNKIVSDTITSIGTGGQNITYTWSGSPNLNLRSRFPTLASGQPVYYRLAVKSSTDNPGPAKAASLIPNPTVFGNGSSYIYTLTGVLSGS
jgi:hypothetical protein